MSGVFEVSGNKSCLGGKINQIQGQKHQKIESLQEKLNNVSLL